jgi:protein O-mannosyl-transferase
VPHSHSSSSGLGLLSLLICYTTAIAYWPDIQAAVLWDDDNHVTRADLQSLTGSGGYALISAPASNIIRSYFPRSWWSTGWWGDAMVGHRLTNIAPHLISALLVVLILRRLKLPGARLACCLPCTR